MEDTQKWINRTAKLLEEKAILEDKIRVLDQAITAQRADIYREVKAVHYELHDIQTTTDRGYKQLISALHMLDDLISKYSTPQKKEESEV